MGDIYRHNQGRLTFRFFYIPKLLVSCHCLSVMPSSPPSFTTIFANMPRGLEEMTLFPIDSLQTICLSLPHWVWKWKSSFFHLPKPSTYGRPFLTSHALSPPQSLACHLAFACFSPYAYIRLSSPFHLLSSIFNFPESRTEKSEKRRLFLRWVQYFRLSSQSSGPCVCSTLI